MRIAVPEIAAKLAARLPIPVYLVGGTVRNALLGLAGTDTDVAGAMPPDAVAGCLSSSQFAFGTINRRLGTVKIVDRAAGAALEYTAFRTEAYPAGGGHVPEIVAFCDRLEDDAKRRDFKANAVYAHAATGEIVDPLGGVADIEARRLSACVEPEKVFASDGLRILRLARLAATLGFAIEETTFRAASRFAAGLADISPERVRDELEKILHADEAYPALTAGTDPHFRGLTLLDELGALAYVIPELEEGKGLAQRPDFHRYEVFRHALETVRYAAPEVRLAALLHDIAKPYCFRTTGRYAGHDVEGERMARAILTRLRYPNRVISEVSRLVGLHMYDLSGATRESKVRVKIAENRDLFDKLLALKQADYLGCGLKTGPSPVVKRWRAIYEKMLEDGTPFSVTDLALTARDMTERFSLTGSRLGEARRALWLAAVREPRVNRSKETAARYLAGMLRKETEEKRGR